MKPFIGNKIEKNFVDFFLLGETETVLKYSGASNIQYLNAMEKVLLVLTLVQNGQKEAAGRIAAALDKQNKNNRVDASV